jgi:hypothetical protein
MTLEDVYRFAYCDTATEVAREKRTITLSPAGLAGDSKKQWQEFGLLDLCKPRSVSSLS